MPAVLRQIGPAFVNLQGNTVKPKALIKWCEGCGFEGASFGMLDDKGHRLWFCGWRAEAPVCVGKGKA